MHQRGRLFPRGRGRRAHAGDAAVHLQRPGQRRRSGEQRPARRAEAHAHPRVHRAQRKRLARPDERGRHARQPQDRRRDVSRHPRKQRAVDWHEETRAISFLRDDEVLDTVELPAEPPTVRLHAQPAGLAGRPDVLRIDWEADTGAAAPGGGEPPVFLVRFSNDGGETWRAVAADLADTTHVLSTKLLPGGERCLLQVLASTGVRTATAESDVFAIERKPREAFLVAPEPDARFRAGQPVILRGGAFSPDALTTTFDEVTWSSNRDGVLGVGYEVAVRTLSAGRHRITMSFPDGLGGEGTASVWIEVGPGS